MQGGSDSAVSSARTSNGGMIRNNGTKHGVVAKAWTTPPTPLNKNKLNQNINSNKEPSPQQQQLPQPRGGVMARPSGASVRPRVTVATSPSATTSSVDSLSQQSTPSSSAQSPSAPPPVLTRRVATPRANPVAYTTSQAALPSPTVRASVARAKSPAHSGSGGVRSVGGGGGGAAAAAAAAAVPPQQYAPPQAAPAPILKRHTSKYSRPPPPAPVWFRIAPHKHPPTGMSSSSNDDDNETRATTTTSPPFRIWCVPLPTDLYRTVAHQLNTSPELLRLFYVSSQNKNGNGEIGGGEGTTKAVVEIVRDRDLAQCLAECGTTVGLGGTVAAVGGVGTDARSAIPLVAVVDDGGALGRVCLSLGAKALHAGQWVAERMDHWWRDPRRIPLRQWIGDVPGLGAGPRPDGEAPPSATTLVILGVVGAGMAVAFTGLALFALDGMLDRIRSRAPRVSYKPTRQMVALGHHRQRSPTALFLPPPPMRGPPMPMTPPNASSAGR